MKTTIFKNMAAAAIFALGLAAAVSCDPAEKTDGGEGDTTKYTIELVHKTHESINIPQNDAEDRKVDLKTNLGIDKLKVYEKDGKDWCLASLIEEEGTIKVLLDPIDDLFDQDLTATFIVEAIGVDVAPLKFTVNRSKYIYVRISSSSFEFSEEEMFPEYKVNPKGETLIITVDTNADTWNFSDFSKTSDKSWYNVDKTSGNSGEQITFTFQPNTTNSMNIGDFSFGDELVVDGDHSYYLNSSSLMIKQEPDISETATKIEKIVLYDTMGEQSEYKNGDIMQISKNVSPYQYNLQIYTSGNYDVKIFDESGNTEIDSNWFIVESGTNYFHSLDIKSNDTGMERKVVLKIFGASTENELFRCTVIQAAE